jgi:hypothetical protein
VGESSFPIGRRMGRIRDRVWVGLLRRASEGAGWDRTGGLIKLKKPI